MKKVDEHYSAGVTPVGRTFLHVRLDGPNGFRLLIPINDTTAGFVNAMHNETITKIDIFDVLPYIVFSDWLYVGETTVIDYRKEKVLWEKGGENNGS
jgi:hypothetical protein